VGQRPGHESGQSDSAEKWIRSLPHQVSTGERPAAGYDQYQERYDATGDGPVAPEVTHQALDLVQPLLLASQMGFQSASDKPGVLARDDQAKAVGQDALLRRCLFLEVEGTLLPGEIGQFGQAAVQPDPDAVRTEQSPPQDLQYPFSLYCSPCAIYRKIRASPPSWIPSALRR
jgi:hypothetical protein